MILLSLRDPAAVARLVLGADKAVWRATSDRLAIEIGASVADLALDMGSGLLCCTHCPLPGSGVDEEPAKLGAVLTGAADLVRSCPIPRGLQRL